MGLVSRSIGNLIGGVSQQPDSLRYANMASESINAFPDLANGLDKRNPTEHITELIDSSGAGLDTATTSKFHVINRSPSERYALVFYNDSGGDPAIKAFNLLSGEEVNIYNSESVALSASDLTGYLPNGTPMISDVDLLTVSDHTFVLNKEIETALSSTTTDAQTVEAFVSIKAGAYAQKYGLLIDGVEYKIDMSGTGGNTTVPPDSPASNDPVDGETPDGSNRHHAKYVGTDVIAEYLKYDILTTALGCSCGTGTFNNGSGQTVSWENATGGSFKLEFHGKAPNNTSMVATTGAIAHDADATALASAIELCSDAFTVSTVTDNSSGALSSFKVKTSRWGIINTENVYANIVENTLSASVDTYNVNRSGHVLHIQKPDPTTGDPTDFSIEMIEGSADRNMSIAMGSVESLSDLPPRANHGTILKVAGLVDDTADDYYVEFITDDDGASGMSSGRWEETVGFGVETSWDATTMPHVLESHIDDGSGPVGEANAPYFIWNTFPWSDRECGDDETNKASSFKDTTIQAMVFHRNRFGLISGESLALSEAGEPGNFWRNTVIDLLDSDRIDITARSRKLSLIKSAVEVQESLVLIADQVQFRLDDGGTLLTPSSAGLRQVSAYEVKSGVPPVAVGTEAFYVQRRGDFSGVNRFFNASTGSANIFRSLDATPHVPRYIKGNIVDMTSSEGQGLLACTTQTSGTGAEANVVYMHKWADIGERRVQSAWFKFDLGSGATIRGIEFVEDDLYLAVERSSTLYLEKIALGGGIADSGAWYKARVDRRISHDNADVTVTWDSGTGKTTVNVPYVVTDDVTLVEKHAGAQAGGTYVTETPEAASGGTTDIIFDGDYSSKDFWVGVDYEMRHSMSDPKLVGPTRGGESRVLTGRFHVRRVFVDVASAGSWLAEVTAEGRSVASKEYAADMTGSNSSVVEQEGINNVPILAVSGGYTFDIVNSTPYSSRFVALEYEGDFKTRSRRVG